MHITSKLLSGIAALALSTAALAFPVDLTSVNGSFINPAGGQNVQGTGTDTITWGYPSYAQSGYKFTGPNNLPSTISDDSPFTLGTFTHVNNPIGSNGAITGVDLSVDLGFGGFGDSSIASGSFLFSHDETPNNAPVFAGWTCESWNVLACVFGFAQWVEDYDYNGPVDDHVILDEAFATSSEFQLGNNIYALELIGFAGQSMTEFFTQESDNSSIDLLARLSVTAVPEPGTLALLSLGVLGLGAARRRKS